MMATQLLAQQISSIDSRTARIEKKLDKIYTLEHELKKLPVLKKKIDEVFVKTEQWDKIKWQFIGGFTVFSILIQCVIFFVRSF